MNQMSNFNEAEQRIKENLFNRNSFLDLANLSLIELPDSLFELKHLERLALTNNDLTLLDPRIASLSNLQILGLNYNKLVSLPCEIGQLKNLISLDCWNNQITTIPIELGQLENLNYLTLGFNKLESIPSELFYFLSRLKALDFQSNPFSLMPAIHEMELFDLMAYFRNESSYYGFVEVPADLSIVCQQFFNFFPEYLRRVTGNSISLDVIHTKSGLKLTTHETSKIDINTINYHFEDYLKTLLPGHLNTNPIVNANSPEGDLLKLQLKLQAQHFESQVEILQFENRYLKKLVDDLVNVQGIMAKNPTPINLTVKTNVDKDMEELMAKLRVLVQGNEDAVNVYNKLEGEVSSKTPNLDRIKFLWSQLSEKSPTVLALVEIAKNIFGI